MRRHLLAFVLCACTPSAPSGPSGVTASGATASATAVATASAAPKKLDPLSADALKKHVAFLCSDELAGREAGSAGERRAIDDAAKRLRALGLEPSRQTFDISGGGKSSNLYALVRGTQNETIVIGAHIDHLGVREGKTYRGAEDNASGVAVVMGVAAHLAQKKRLDRSVAIVFFGAEEIGMVGSRRFVAELPPLGGPVVAMVNVDMIGRPIADDPLYSIPKRMLRLDDRRSVGVLGTRDRPAFRKAVDDAFASVELKAIGVEDLPPAMARYVDRIADGRGDSFSFEGAGIPALFFSSGESVDYHQPSDTPDRLSFDIMAERARAILALVVALADKRVALPEKSK